MKLEPHEIAEIHASRLEQTHSEPEDPNYDARYKQAVNNEVHAREVKLKPGDAPNPYILFEEPVTPAELKPLLKETKNKAPRKPQKKK